MKTLSAVAANDECISPIGWPIVPLTRIAPAKRQDRDRKAQPSKPAPRDDKPKPG